MKFPEHFDASQIAAQPPYEWSTVLFNTFWAVTDEDCQWLIDALMLTSNKAAFALAVACSEWVVARVRAHVDVSDALLRIEAAKAAAIDPRYAQLPPPPPSPDHLPYESASPLRLAMKILAYAHEHSAFDGEGVHSSAQGLAMLAGYLIHDHPAYLEWLHEALRRCQRHFSAEHVTVLEEPPVPPGLFDADFSGDIAALRHAAKDFVRALAPADNPYLRSAREMLDAGFPGAPYEG